MWCFSFFFGALPRSMLARVARGAQHRHIMRRDGTCNGSHALGVPGVVSAVTGTDKPLTSLHASTVLGRSAAPETDPASAIGRGL